MNDNACNSEWGKACAGEFDFEHEISAEDYSYFPTAEQFENDFPDLK